MRKARFAAALLAAALLLPLQAHAAGEETSPTIAAREASEDLLLVVDFQNVYLPDRDWACPSMPEAVENTLRILEAPKAPEYILTKYIAPTDPVGRWQQYNEAYAEINENAYLSELVKELEPYADAAHVVEKSTYSSLKAERAIAALEGKKAVVLCGVVADCCVLATMFDAMDMGYEVVYLTDCIAGMSSEGETAIKELAEVFSPIHTTIMTSEEYLASLR